MGNSFCCPSSNPCDHTVDETQGLLNSPDSKVSVRPLTTDGVAHAVEVEESSKNEADCIKQDKDVIRTQPLAVPVSAELSAQSSYGSVIQILHTEVSLAAQTSQSASSISKVPKELADEVRTATETKDDEGLTTESQTSAPGVTDAQEVKVLTELVKVEDETGAEINDVLKVENKAGELKLKVQDAQAEVLADEPQDVQLDPQTGVTEEETAEGPAEAGRNKESAEMNRKQKDDGVDTEEKLQAPGEVFPVVDGLQTKEPVPNILEVVYLEAEGLLAPVDVAQNNADIFLPEHSSAEPQVSVSETTSEREQTVSAIESSAAEKGLEHHEKHTVPSMSTVKEDLVPPKTQETPKQESTPAMNSIEECTVSYREKGQADDLTVGDVKDESSAEVEGEEPQINERLQKLCEEPSPVGNQELMFEDPSNSKSVVEETTMESTDMGEVQTTVSQCTKEKGDVQAGFQDDLDVPASVETPESKDEPDEEVDENQALGQREALSLDDENTEEREPASQTRENETKETEDNNKNDESNQSQKGEIILSSSHDMKVSLIPVSELENIAEKEEEHDGSEGLYRGEDETEQEQTKEIKVMPLLEFTIPGVEEMRSFADPVDILAYSEQEWKGNTEKSNLIRKGYSEISCSFTGLRRVRGDNYCALRATLYQILATTTQTPAWLLEEDFTSLPEKFEAEEDLIGMWKFPAQCIRTGEKKDAVEKLKQYLELLQKRWQEAAESASLEDKQDVCDDVFQGGEEEYALLEALKFLMLVKAMELHNKMQAGQEVPVFCWLMFARDTSETPKMFFNNHLRPVGFTGGVEQVEMFLLGYTLQHTIQAFRLYKTDTEEFVTHYPDDHKHDWPCVCIITEDDRHYNVPVRKATQYQV